MRQNIGLDLNRLENHEEPLDSRSMSPALPGVRELRDEDKDGWYRLLYWTRSGWIYVLHCFRKKTATTPHTDIEKAKSRMKAIEERRDAPYGRN